MGGNGTEFTVIDTENDVPAAHALETGWYRRGRGNGTGAAGNGAPR